MSFTTIVGVDAQHLEELEIAWPAWARHCPAVVDSPILLLADLDGNRILRLRSLIPHGRIFEARAALPDSFPREQVTQRELMLSAITHAPRLIDTPHFLKLDTDTLAYPGGDDLLRDHGDAAIVAPRWNYTKPGHWLDTLDRWADQVRPANPKPPREQVGNIAKHSRIIGYAMLGETAFARELLDLLPATGRLPVPSQDTFSHYGAALLGRRIVRLRGDRTRWRHCGGSIERMRQRYREAMCT